MGILGLVCALAHLVYCAGLRPISGGWRAAIGRLCAAEGAASGELTQRWRRKDPMVATLPSVVNRSVEPRDNRGHPGGRPSKSSASFATSVALNKRITGALSWEDIVEILRSASPDIIDDVCVATAFHRAAKLGARSSPGPRETDLAQIIALIESKIDELGSRELANILWSFAKLGLRPEPALWDALSEKAERSAGSFNSQNVANTLWAFATLGIPPSETLLAALSSAAERSAGSFNSQAVANTLWAFATLGIPPSKTLLAALSSAAERSAGSFIPQELANTLWAMAVLHIEPPSSLAQRASELGTALNDEGIEQISYAHLVGQALGWSMQLPDELVQRAQSVQRRLAQQPSVSRLQQRVYEALQGMGQQPQLEALTDDGLFSIDIALPESEQDGRPKTAVEVDGPSHFTSSGSKTGNTQLRDFLLEQRGWRVVSLPYFAINAASTDAELNECLAGALRP